MPKDTTKSEKFTKRSAYYGKTNDEVGTPPEFYDELNEEFNFDYDPCPLGGKEIKDGLITDWGKRNYVNPPYSEIGNWIKKGVEEKLKGKLSVFLVTARTNSVYWKKYVVPHATEIRWFNTSLTFTGYEKPFRIPLVLIVFDPNAKPCCSTQVKDTYTYYTS